MVAHLDVLVFCLWGSHTPVYVVVVGAMVFLPVSSTSRQKLVQQASSQPLDGGLQHDCPSLRSSLQKQAMVIFYLQGRITRVSPMTLCDKEKWAGTVCL